MLPIASILILLIGSPKNYLKRQIAIEYKKCYILILMKLISAFNKLSIGEVAVRSVSKAVVIAAISC